MEGLPPKVHVNRLEEGIDGQMFACTNHGLFHLNGSQWRDMQLPLVCYAYREYGSIGFAATQHGLWCNTPSGWKMIASERNAVYDFLMTPHYIYLALPWGIAMYDRLTCTWEQFALKACIIRLASFDGALMGVTDKGEIALGDLKGGFHRIRMPGIFVFNAVRRRASLYLCADRGLYRAVKLRGQMSLVSVTLGCPVTDMELRDGRMHLATLHEGIQTIQWD